MRSVPPIYKFLTTDMRSPIGTSEPWEIGKTMRVKGDLIPCENGLHGWPLLGLLNFTAERLVRVEIGAEYVWHGEGVERKIVTREMTPVELIEAYNDRTLRLFAADCVERVLPLFELERPNDARPRRAIETARRFANGEATREDLAADRAAAMDAAMAAAMDAAWAAAMAAAMNADRAAAMDAAWAAALNAALNAAMNADRAAALDVVLDAALDAEHEWQAQHLAQMLGLEVQP